MIDQKIIKTALEKFETPFYLFDKKGFIDNYQALETAFRKIYPSYSIAYSYKTNYIPYVCQIVKKGGGYAEVVSDMEYYLAKKIGYDDKKIIYNGPIKGAAMEKMLLGGGIVNIDNYQECSRVISLAKVNPGLKIKVGIRLNFDIGANYISRFGVELGGEELNHVLEELNQTGNVSVVGLHCHMSRARSLDSWKKRIDTMLEAADIYINGIPEYIDVGSGMFADLEECFASQFDMDIPSYDEYAAVVAGSMSEHYKDCEVTPLLISEPGTTVISRYLELVTSVIQIKEIRGRVFATVNSSFHNAGSTCLMKQLPYQLFHNDVNSKKSFQNADIMGYTCLEQDRIYKSLPGCAIYSVEDDSHFKEIRRKELYEDIFKGYSF